MIPRRLKFGDSSSDEEDFSTPPSFNIDYGAAMGIVGFVSSFITRLRCRGHEEWLEDELISFITEVSLTHKSQENARQVLTSLMRSVPEWFVPTGTAGKHRFNGTVKTFEVFGKLREFKRRELFDDQSGCYN